jgi:hypothetical protein
MACHGRALNHVEPRHEHVVVFHEDGVHPSVEAGLRVADASKSSDELVVVLMVVELVLGPKVYPTQQHPPQWYASSHYGIAAHPSICKQVACRLLRSSMGSAVATVTRLAI